MNIKFISTLILSSLFTLLANAAPIDRQQALKQAVDFMKAQNPSATIDVKAVHKSPRKAQGTGTEDGAYYYVFNATDDKGFVIVAGDDHATPILGYSDKGTFDEENIPANMKEWLSIYESEIAWAEKNNISPQTDVQRKATKTDIPHMVTCTWNQDSPYNLLAPKIGTTSTYTGCVATAMAQVAYYWGTKKGFKHGSAEIPAYTSSNGSDDDIEMPALSAVSQFDWDNMTDTYSSSSTQAQKDAVAQLMLYCGQAVNMAYGTSSSGGSGTSSSYIAKGLRNYFGYDKGIRLVSWADVTQSEWEDIIYNELAQGRPVVMSGVNKSFSSYSTQPTLSGHEFVCDGYQASSDKYYFNWGWGGSGNGWFALTALDPNTSGIGGASSGGGYDFLKDVVIGFQPPTYGTSEIEANLLSIPEFFLMGDQRVFTRESRSDNIEDVPFIGVIGNTSTGDSFTYLYGLGLYNQNNELVQVMNTDIDLFSENSLNYFQGNITFGEELPYGEYKIIPICTIDGDDEWHKANGASLYYLTAKIEEKQITITPSCDLKVSDFSTTQSGSLFNRRYTHQVKITNTGCEEFHGVIYVMQGSSGNEALLDLIEATIPAGETQTCTLGYTRQISSSTRLVFSTYAKNFYESTSASKLLWDLGWPMAVDNNLNVCGNEYKFRFALRNTGTGAFNGPITATVYEHGTNVSTGTTQTINAEVDAFSYKEFLFNFPNLTYGKTYNFRITYNGNTMDFGTGDYEYYKFTMSHGAQVVSRNDANVYTDNAKSITVPKKAIYVDARYLDNPEIIRPNENTNTLYILAEGATIPASLAGKNVVVGNKADNIAMEDGIDFISPIDFVANNISYKRIFNEGINSDKGNWSTIYLPFDVASIRNATDDKPINWYRSANDETNDLWLMEFSKEADNGIQFDYANSFSAYKPYLINVPSEQWNTDKNLVGKELVFSGTDAQIKAFDTKGVFNIGGKYDMIGYTEYLSRAYIYSMNDEGKAFEFTKSEVECKPFRAYFAGYYNQDDLLNVNISTDGNIPTGITNTVTANDGANRKVFNINGMKIATNSTATEQELPRGIYIINGKKVTVK